MLVLTGFPCYCLCCRVQAALGNLLGGLIPKAQVVPVVEPKNLHPDPEVVSAMAVKSGECGRSPGLRMDAEVEGEHPAMRQRHLYAPWEAH